MLWAAPDAAPIGIVLTQIMPPAMRRNKFATDARNASWTTAPASSVWDLRRLRAYAASEWEWDQRMWRGRSCLSRLAAVSARGLLALI